LHFWYDERNLPIQIGDNEYRYTADGQRYYKKVGTVEEYYIMDDNLTAGVFSNTGTGYELDYWNILGHGVEGRYTLTGVPIIDTTNTISSETEPNDTQATANGPVGLQPVTGEQTDHFDQDWFYFDVLQPGAINIHLEKQGWSMMLAVYDSQLNELDYDDGGTGSRTLWNVAVSPGRYYIEISPREQHSSNIAYTLQLEELNPTYYYFKDHLGSTRVVVNATGTILDATDYYPFGLAMPGRSHTTAPGTKEMFTGHERDHEVGLDYMVARRYDPALGRFLGIDPMADSYSSWSPYAYVLNNPIILIDPTGMCAREGANSGPGGPPECFGFDIATDMYQNARGLFDKVVAFFVGVETGEFEYSDEAFAEVVHEGVQEDLGDIVETSVNEGIDISDNVSQFASAAMPIAYASGPKGITNVTALGTVADASSLFLKGIDYMFFDGSREVVINQGKIFLFNLSTGRGLLKIRKSQKKPRNRDSNNDPNSDK